MKIEYKYKAKVTNIVDGDTIDAEIFLGFRMTTTQRLRLVGIDSAELNAKDPAEKEKAQYAKAFLEGRILNQTVIIETHKSDSFGRYLADIWFCDTNINQELIKFGYAKEYER